MALPTGQPTPREPEREPEDGFRIPVEVERPEPRIERRDEAVETQRERERAPEATPVEEREASARPAPAPTTSRPAPPPPAKSPELVVVEQILEEHLEEVYERLPPREQLLLREKGEETASKVLELLRQAVVKAREVLELIKKWLRIIPGVNRFFLEQEAKIKTDKLLALRERRMKH